VSEPMINITQLKIVSGGQSGADQAALDWAIVHGVDHGGWCPKGRKSEDGKIDPKYQLTETPTANYLERTEWNVRDSDATVVFTIASTLSGGSKKTLAFAQAMAKPCLHFHPRVHAKWLRSFIIKNNVTVLNVAGPRASGEPGIAEFVTKSLDEALRQTEVA
jgi:hypothetical protein